MTQKKCSRCKAVKSVEEFWRDRSTSSGFKSYCKDCKTDRSEYHKQWHTQKLAENPDYWKDRELTRDPAVRRVSNRKSALKQKYGLSLESFEQMKASQDSRCAICKIQPIKELAVDHNHQTGQIRGLLCQVCNQALGMFQDSTDVLEAAIKYLEGALYDDSIAEQN